MDFADIVYTMLKNKGWTQTRLNEAMGYSSPGTMSNRLKRGSMSVKGFSSIADTLGYEVAVCSAEKTVNISELAEMDLSVKTLLDLVDSLGLEVRFSPELESGRG